ncbi:AAA ATPase [Staphylothermus marinus F1]|uniref:AAA ATPase n=1 Tax=Staphylothermus marinus (strain ATCC 43588 / DSM 3639 / JCM 9404 / F1) TaxID=399550 RepID=A3DNT6_STAMF|nr:ATPase domain-containing protein [Staphylothermus marinus]ABN70296.1 AAA ATPase [Staphylothermus marinus F1]
MCSNVKLSITNDLLEGMNKPSVIVIRGPIGSGKSLFISTLINEYIERGMGKANVLLFMVDSMSFFRTAEFYRVPIRKHLENGVLEVNEITSLPMEERRIDSIMEIITGSCMRNKNGLVIIYPAGIAFMGLSKSKLAGLVGVINECKKKYGVKMILSFNKEISKGIREIFESIADYVFSLSIEIPEAGKPRRFITVIKPLRELLGVSRTAEIDIVLGKGMEIVNYGILRQYDAILDISDRVKTSIEWFDKLTNGIVKGTSILIAGPSGAGKTNLLLTIGYGIARNNNKVLFISFEEPPGQLIATMKSLGYNYEEVRDNMKIVGINPRTITLNSLFRVVTEHMNTSYNIIMLDGLHAIWKEFGERYHRFLRDLVYYVKSIGGIIFLSKVLIEREKEKTYTWLSTIVDGIIELGLERINNEYKRYICIKKLRYHKVKSRCYKYHISNGVFIEI